METLLIVLGAFLLNMIAGSAIWAAFDNDNRDWYAWYNNCPARVAWFAQPLVLQCWPVVLYLIWKNKREAINS